MPSHNVRSIEKVPSWLKKDICDCMFYVCLRMDSSPKPYMHKEPARFEHRFDNQNHFPSNDYMLIFLTIFLGNASSSHNELENRYMPYDAIRDFLRYEASGGIVLIVAAALAVAAVIIVRYFSG